MSNITMKDITIPSLNNTYTFAQVDNTLAVTGAAADAKKTGDEISDLKNDLGINSDATLLRSPNLINLETITENVYINQNNGREVASSGYFASDFIPVEAGVEYMMIAWSSSSLIYVNVITEHAWYDSDKNYISGGNSSPTTAPNNASYIRISRVTTNLGKQMFGKSENMSFMLNLGDWAYLPYAEYPKNQKPTIINIQKPFVFYQWNDYCYFRFQKIIYKRYDGTTKEYNFTDLQQKYSSNIVSTNTSRVRNCCLLQSGYSFIFDTSLMQFALSQSVDVDDIVLLTVDSNGKMSGFLYDIYNSDTSYYTARQSYHNMPIDVIDAVDDAIPAVVIGRASERFVFANVADNHSFGTHIGKEVDLTAMAIDYVDKRLPYDAIINCGDEILTNASGGNALVALSNSINSYNIDKMVFCEGNHDRGIIDPVITHRQYYNTVLRHWKDNENVHTVYPKSYYYRDYPNDKIRIVCLTLYDMPDEQQGTYPYNDYYGYDQTQMVWLRDNALNIDSDWSVIVVVHSLPVTSSEGMTGNGTAGQNPTVLRQILESFKNGTNVHVTHSDTVAGGVFEINLSTRFDSQGARNLIGVFGGHTHIDTIVKINGINYVSTCCGYVDSVEYSGNRGNREGLTYSAICFDIGTIDQTERTVNLYRIGFVPTGESSPRTFTY